VVVSLTLPAGIRSAVCGLCQRGPVAADCLAQEDEGGQKRPERCSVKGSMHSGSSCFGLFTLRFTG